MPSELSSGTPAPSWSTILADLEDHAAVLRRALDSGSALPPLPELPGRPGPLDPELVDRARKVVDEIARLEARCSELRDGLGKFLSLADSASAEHQPVYFDSSA